MSDEPRKIRPGVCQYEWFVANHRDWNCLRIDVNSPMTISVVTAYPAVFLGITHFAPAEKRVVVGSKPTTTEKSGDDIFTFSEVWVRKAGNRAFPWTPDEAWDFDSDRGTRVIGEVTRSGVVVLDNDALREIGLAGYVVLQEMMKDMLAMARKAGKM